MANTPVSTPILISGGSAPPCIRVLFERAAFPVEQFSQVWIDPCPNSTFNNFRFSLFHLRQWHSQHIGLVTSGSHSQRALLMGRIILSGHGIWVEPVNVRETGIPGNQESSIKTILDVLRSIAWLPISYIHTPHCPNFQSLDTMDLRSWQARGFKCEHQGNISTIPNSSATSQPDPAPGP